MSIEAMKRVVAAWDKWDGGTLDHPLSFAMEALRQAVEQAEQDPIGDAQDRLIAEQQERIFDCPRCGHCCPGTAEQAQPVAWMNKHGACMSAVFKEVDATAGEYTVPLYTSPPQRQPVEWLTGCPECGMDGECGCKPELPVPHCEAGPEFCGQCDDEQAQPVTVLKEKNT